jgi:Protein of unknown function (DUF1826)
VNATLVQAPPTTCPAFRAGGTPDGLADILDPAVQLAIWQRPRPAALAWVDALDWDEIDDIDAPIDGPEFEHDVAQRIAAAGYPAPSRDALIADIAALAGRFARLMQQARLRLRLEVIETDACRKFHMDHVTARLLMPLFGPGTQWIEAPFDEETPIRQLALGDVALFKGRQWVEEPAILHRSPPVAATGEARLLLAIDPFDGDAG